MLLMARPFVKNVPNYCAGANAVAEKSIKISAEMLVKQNSIFSAIYFMLAPLRIAQIG
jgi:hypothetical protein